VLVGVVVNAVSKCVETEDQNEAEAFVLTESIAEIRNEIKALRKEMISKK
jgi:hypothetical protein